MIALVREISPSITECELTHLERTPIDLELAREQHRAYVTGLAAAGCEVCWLPPLPEQPDAVFVEDAAVVVDEVAVITRPGAASRRPETASVAEALRPLRPLAQIEAPGTLDGGDVLRLGKRLFVGLSGRSTPAGIDQLGAILEPHGYEVSGVPIHGCLHLKSAAAEVAVDTVLVDPRWVDPARLGARRVIEVDPGEPGAANAVRVGQCVLHPLRYPATRRRLEAAGIAVVPVPASELAKAEGGVSCCSIVVDGS